MSTVNDNNNQDFLTPTHHIRSLESQIEAMTNAFKIQEKILAENGKEVAIKNAKFSKQKENESIAEAFPYYSLLQSWRKKTIETLMAKAYADKQLESAYNSIKSERSKHIKELKEMESQLIIYQQRNAAMFENNELLLKQQKQLFSQLENEKSHHSNAVANVNNLQKNIKSLSSYLNQFKCQVDSLAVEDSKKW